MDTILLKTARWIQWTGVLSIFAGLLYFPYFPWYLLGNETEAEITLWAMLATGGGVLAWLGSRLLWLKSRAVQQISLITALLGMLLFLLGQVSPIYFWFIFRGSPITEGPVEQAAIGSFLPMLPHLAIAFLALFTAGIILKDLASPGSPIRLSAKRAGASLAILLLLFAGWLGWSKYLDATWIENTYPNDGAVNVPLYDTITVQWKQEASSMGMEVRYADDSSIPILGATSGSKDGMSFTPEMYLPGKKVLVTVTAGRRSHTFSFTTAKEADDQIGLYRAVMKHLFRSPQVGQPPEVLAFDTSSLETWKEHEKRTVAKGLMAYHGQVVFGTIDGGFSSAEPSFTVPLTDQTEALLLSIEVLKQEFDEYQVRVTGTKGRGILAGKPGEVYQVDYTLQFLEGVWEVTSLSEKVNKRPWG